MIAALHRYAAACLRAVTVAMVATACSRSPAGPTTPTIKVTAITPATGSTTGGTMVTVAGAEFGADTTLTIGGVSVSNIVVQSTTTLSATIGAQPAAGPADVVASSGGKSATLTRGFTLVAPSGSNQPPVTTSIRAIAPRPNQPSAFANIDDSVTLIPAISNHEPGSSLQFAWTGSGAFSPSSADGTTTWRVPSTAAPAPQPLTATLMVSETFNEGGVSHTQTAAPFGVVLQVHDSEKEVMDMGEDFLTRFTKQLPTADVLHNFSPTCDDGRGRSTEASDVDANRAEFIEDFNAFRISRRSGFSINFKGSCSTGSKPPQLNVDGCSSFSVHWEGIEKKTNTRFVINGIDYVSAVVENNVWKLCHSTFVGTESYPSLGITRAVSW